MDPTQIQGSFVIILAAAERGILFVGDWQIGVEIHITVISGKLIGLVPIPAVEEATAGHDHGLLSPTTRGHQIRIPTVSQVGLVPTMEPRFEEADIQSGPVPDGRIKGRSPFNASVEGSLAFQDHFVIQFVHGKYLAMDGALSKSILGRFRIESLS